MKKRSRTGVNLDELNIIDESHVPPRHTPYTPYSDMLKRIRKGKALVISDEQLSVDTVRAGIRRLQNAGKFKKFIIRSVKGEDGIRQVYIINPSEEEKPDIAVAE